MASWVGLLLLLCVWCFIEDHMRVGARTISEQNDIELENQLKLLNKPPVTTIWTKHGKKYDCVDFYAQPTFDHPALKKHDFRPPQVKQMTWLKKRTNNEEDSSIISHEFGQMWQNGKGCPSGTVPIKKTTKDDLIKIKIATEIYSTTYNSLTDGQPGKTHYAVAHTNNHRPQKFNGAGMDNSIWNPKVSGTQYSSSQMKLVNGDESIEAGWMVNPSLYNDTQTHFFIYTKRGASHCYNLYCPGFIIARPDVAIDEVLGPVSQRGEVAYSVNISIYRDSPTTGKWLLEVGPNKTVLGYWPQKLFSGLADSAGYVEWGGKVYSSSDEPSPPMGGGYLPGTLGIPYDAFCRRLVIVNESFAFVEAMDTTVDDEDLGLYEAINLYTYDPDEQILYYGGVL